MTNVPLALFSLLLAVAPLSGCAAVWRSEEPSVNQPFENGSDGAIANNDIANNDLAQNDPEKRSRDLFSDPPSFKEIVENAERNAETGESDEQLREYGHRWLYGRGMGRSMANIGTVVAFPPYAFYLVGNAGLALAGYEQLHVTSLVPEPARDYILTAYDGITSLPGRLAALIAGEEYQQ